MLRAALLACMGLGACKARPAETGFEELVGRLTRGDRGDRLTAMHALVQLGDTRAVGPLLARYRDSGEEGFVREMAIISVARLGDPGVFSYVMEQLPAALDRDDAFGVRPAMLGKALVESGPKTLPPLIELTMGRDPRARDWAITHLGGYRGEPAALSALLQLVQSSDPGIRERVVDSLGQLFMPEAGPAIHSALTDPDPRVRRAAAQAWRNVTTVSRDGGIPSR